MAKQQIHEYKGEFALCWLRLGDHKARQDQRALHGLTYRQVRVLLTIATCNEIANGACTFGAIADAECISRATIVQAVREMDPMGLIERIGTKRAVLTAKGFGVVNDYLIQRRKHLTALRERLLHD